jgi:hypothetical protein
MKKRKETIPGDLIKIPFKEGVHTYARILIERSYLIYDCRSTIDRDDFENIIHSDVLFIARVNIFGVKKGYWKIVTNIPLEDNLKDFHPKYFNPAPTNTDDVEFYKLHKEEIEDAIGKDWIKSHIQIDGIHDLVHIELRINDYYDGKINKWNRANIELFKKCLG